MPCRDLRGTKHGKSRGFKTRKEVVNDRDTTDIKSHSRLQRTYQAGPAIVADEATQVWVMMR